MQSQNDELNLSQQHNKYHKFYQLPQQQQSLRKNSIQQQYSLKNPMHQYSHKNPIQFNYQNQHYLQQLNYMQQNFKFINQKYPLKQLFHANEQDIQNFMYKNKHFFGIKYLFGLQNQKNNDDFLQDIDSQIFNKSFYDNPNLVDLNKFFQQDQYPQSQQSQHKKLLDQLTTRLSEIQNKAFSGISIHKTIGKAFYQHFQNYLKLRNVSNFFQNFSISFEKFIKQTNKIKKNGLSLILIIYEFWMRMFREFVREIWRHSEKYTIGLFKKNKYNYQTQRNNMEYQQSSNKSSTSSSQQGQKIQKEKRKPWSKNQLDILQKIINSNATFNMTRLQKLAEEFGRSSTSISSKIQKIIKFKKNNEQQNYCCLNEDTIEKKIQFTLKLYPAGLSKDQVVKKINQLYQMGLQQNWKKSVCQILSSKKNIQKIKGTFRLVNPQNYFKYQNYQTTKDKIIHTLLQFQNYQADLKSLSHKYIQLFINKQKSFELQDKDKTKTIQTNLSKALNRYDIFQKTNEKVIYRLMDIKQSFNQQMQMQNYIN